MVPGGTGLPGHDQLAELRPGSPRAYGSAEWFVRTLKEHLLWIRVFDAVAELIEALREFERTYHEQWLIERHEFRTPSQVRIDWYGGSGGLDTRTPCRDIGWTMVPRRGRPASVGRGPAA
jgi:hypothetical protein